MYLSVPHSNALVITLRIANYNVKQILVDTGSLADILFMQPYLKMGLKPSSLEPMRDPLIAFNGSQAVLAGWITLPVRAGEETILTEFIVMDLPSPYNAILGHTWLGPMNAIPSTYHQKLCFLTSHGIMEIQGDQSVARRCYAIATSSKAKAKKQHGGEDDIHPKR
ncbi:hypothetical protein QJS04_geneDACA008540 [Acorus gramineus]|uniref:Uncharacterized protein n=1 Tax=Acorus gramineus TaxID=55184 RepID=A0AAV9AFR0_ACOGR|nr:hypothetical protein QJS04_geneDACA008540 [Acorus gramineus]